MPQAAHVAYSPILIVTLVGELLLLSLQLADVMMAARKKQFQAFMALTQMLVLPLFLLSGALYPLNGRLPGSAFSPDQAHSPTWSVPSGTPCSSA